MRKIILLIILSMFSQLVMAEVKVVGLISDLSGYNVNSGTRCKNGFDLAIRQASPKLKTSVKFVFEDTQSFPKIALTAFQKLNSNNELIAGAVYSSPNILAISPSAKKLEVPLVGLFGNTIVTQQNERIFSAWMSAKDEGETLANDIISKNLKKVAIISTEHDYMQDIAKYFSLKLQEQGGEIVEDQNVAHDLLEFKSLANRMLSKKPEAIFINLHTGAAPSFLKQIRDFAYQGEVYSNYYLSRRNEIEAAGIEASEGVKIVSLAVNNPQFVQSFSELFGDSDQLVLEYACYSGVQLLVQALEESVQAQKLTKQGVFEKLSEITQVQLFDKKLAVKDRWISHLYQVREIRAGKLSH